MISRNCGGTITLNGTTRWYSASEIYNGVLTGGGTAPISGWRRWVFRVLSRFPGRFMRQL